MEYKWLGMNYEFWFHIYINRFEFLYENNMYFILNILKEKVNILNKKRQIFLEYQ